MFITKFNIYSFDVLKQCFVKFENSTTNFLMLENSQFIENVIEINFKCWIELKFNAYIKLKKRVYEDDVPGKKVEEEKQVITTKRLL